MQNIIKEEKKDDFKVFCNNLKKDTNPNYIWSTLKKFQNRFNSKNNTQHYSTQKVNAVRNQIAELFLSWTPTEPSLPSDYDPLS